MCVRIRVAGRYIEMVLDMSSRVLKDTRQSEKEAKVAAQLVMVILHHCPGRVDHYLPAMLAMLNDRLRTVGSSLFACSLFSLWKNAKILVKGRIIR